MLQMTNEALVQAALQAVSQKLNHGNRVLVGIAGPPASGKSTFSDALRDRLTREGVLAVVVPMDGFHLDNRVLDEMGIRHKKGAPESFDVDGFLTLLCKLRDADFSVYLPVFEREKDLSIAAARVVRPETQVVIVEGNYLLFDEPAWKTLSELWDISIWIDTPEDVVLQRCIQRWMDYGHTPEAAQARAEDNDLANAQRIARARLPSDLVLSDSADGP